MRCQIGHDFAKYGRKLEAMPGQPGRETDVWKIGMSVDHELLVGRHRVIANDMFRGLVRNARHDCDRNDSTRAVCWID